MIRTIGDLRGYLDRNNLSPEQLARQIGISNMTIRRMLRNADSGELPQKYAMQFGALDVGTGMDLDGLMKKLEADAKKAQDLDKLQTELDAKLRGNSISGEVREKVSLVLRGALSKGNRKYAALCAGALLYFINPFDVIPDALMPFGFLDDLAVLSIVAASAPIALRGKKS